MSSPRPTDDIDQALRKNLKQVFRMRWYLFGAVFAVLLVAVVVMAVIIGNQQSDIQSQHGELQASCEFWRALAPLPASFQPPAKAPSELSVTLISGARSAFAGQDCGTIPPAAPSLVTWARYYRIKTP